MKFAAAITALVLTFGQAAAQYGGPVPQPFLFVKIKGAGDTKTVWYPGTRGAFTTGDQTMAVRPGYTYRVELNDIPGAPGTRLFPSFEVRGTLHAPQGMDAAKHPVPVAFSEAELREVLGGKLITKVYYLENPDKAISMQSKEGEALELNTVNEEESFKEARDKGRPVLVVRLGERPFTDEELAGENVPGTVWVPGTSPVAVPAFPPRFTPFCMPMYDPLLGPKISNFECLHDGGDHKVKLGIGPDNKIAGLDPSDTAIEFTTGDKRRVLTSNRVCLCVPRFIALRSATIPEGGVVIHGPRIDNQMVGAQIAARKTPPLGIVRVDQLKGAIGSLKASGQIGLVGPHAYLSENRAIAVGQVKGVKVVAEATEPDDLTFFPNCTLMLQKRVEPRNPEKIGEIVTFTLRYYNPMPDAIGDVVVSDSLTARLEFIEGTAKSDRPVTFTATPNEAGSVALKWALTDKLAPGHSGVITFQARIR